MGRERHNLEKYGNIECDINITGLIIECTHSELVGRIILDVLREDKEFMELKSQEQKLMTVISTQQTGTVETFQESLKPDNSITPLKPVIVREGEMPKPDITPKGNMEPKFTLGPEIPGKDYRINYASESLVAAAQEVMEDQAKEEYRVS